VNETAVDLAERLSRERRGAQDKAASEAKT